MEEDGRAATRACRASASVGGRPLGAAATPGGPGWRCPPRRPDLRGAARAEAPAQCGYDGAAAGRLGRRGSRLHPGATAERGDGGSLSPQLPGRTGTCRDEVPADRGPPRCGGDRGCPRKCLRGEGDGEPADSPLSTGARRPMNL